MQRGLAMRRHLLLVILFTATASAAPARKQPVLADVHSTCRVFADLAGSQATRVALSARVSLATCEAEERLRSFAFVDYEASAEELVATVNPTLELIAKVATSTDPVEQIAALDADAKLRSALGVRVMSSVPSLPDNASPDLVEQHAFRVQLLRERVSHWFERARADYAEIERIAQAHPELAHDPVVAAALADVAHPVEPTIAMN